jgi:hypothetical protein
MHHRISVLIALASFAGCSNDHGMANVAGTVLYKNQPVDGATVIFHSKGEGPAAKPAQGKTNRSGHFTLSTNLGPTEQEAGALPGNYTVTVTKIDEPQGAYDPLKDPPLKSHLPAKYGTALTSPLAVTIKAGSNRPELKLED